MRVHAATAIMGTPDVGMLMGAVAPQSTLDAFNSNYGTAGLGDFEFGGVNDVMASAYKTFTNAIVKPVEQTMIMLEKGKALIRYKDQMITLRTEDDLESVPKCMHIPIMTSPMLRGMFMDERIDGFGIEPEDMPHFDPYENVLEYGYIETDHEGNFPKHDISTWSTDDPDISLEDVDHLRASRNFIEVFITKELDAGTLRDPTAMVDGLLIGELR